MKVVKKHLSIDGLVRPRLSFLHRQQHMNVKLMHINLAFLDREDVFDIKI
jgi:hypothetical protein